MFCLASVCCVCLQGQRKLISLNKLDDDSVKFKEKFQFCFPNIVCHNKIPNICSNCCPLLKKVYNFKKLYLNSEKKLKSYLVKLCKNNCVQGDLYVKIQKDTRYNQSSDITGNLENVKNEEAIIGTSDVMVVLQNVENDSIQNKSCGSKKPHKRNSRINTLRIRKTTSNSEKNCEESTKEKSDLTVQYKEDIIGINNESEVMVKSEKVDDIKVEVPDIVEHIDEVLLLLKKEMCANEWSKSDEQTLNSIKNSCIISDDASITNIQFNESNIAILRSRSNSETDISHLSDDDLTKSNLPRKNPALPEITQLNLSVQWENVCTSQGITDPTSVGCAADNVQQTKENLKEVVDLSLPEKNVSDTTAETEEQKKPYECTYCQKRFSKSQSLTQHKKIHTNVRKFECNICQKRFVQLGYLKRHRTIHTDPTSVGCAAENVQQTKENLMEVEDLSLPEKNVSNTTAETEEQEKPYECTYCHKRFKQAKSLNRHQKIHTDDRKFECDICQKRFVESGLLKRHRTIHTGDQPFECDECPKRFTHMSTLKTHRLYHTGIKAHVCKICDKRFVTRAYLRDHLKIHLEPIKCDVCNKCFTYKSNLVDHMYVHNGEKPYKCKECHKQFTRLNRLNDHAYIHTGQKRYECDICHKKITHSSTLTKHRRIHTREKPYKCQECHKSFTHSSYLQLHKKEHLKDKEKPS